MIDADIVCLGDFGKLCPDDELGRGPELPDLRSGRGELGSVESEQQHAALSRGENEIRKGKREVVYNMSNAGTMTMMTMDEEE